MPPMTKRNQPSRSGGESSSPALMATGLPPQSIVNSRAASPARSVSGRRGVYVAGGYPDRVSGQSPGLWCPWFGMIFNRKGQ